MRSPFDPIIRDGHPGLVDTSVREASITRNRFLKAQKIADALAVLPTDWPADATDFTPEQWAAAMLAAGVVEASPATRVLVVELLKDRERQMEGLMDEVEAIEHVRLNYEPMDVFGRPG